MTEIKVIHEQSADSALKVLKMERDTFAEHAIGLDVLQPFLKHQMVLTLYHGQELCGYAICISDCHNSDLVYLFSFAVAQEFRGKGLGKAAFLALTDWLARKGYSRLELTVAPDNHAAKRIYSTMTVVETSFSRDYYGPMQHRELWQLKL